MIKIKKKSYGYYFVFNGFIQPEETTKWYNESVQILKTAPPSFGIFVDMRKLVPLAPACQLKIEEGQRLYKEKGMVRSVIVLDSPIITMQFKRIARKTGIDAWERYIDASSNPNWEIIGVNWIEKGIDPDI